MTAFRDEDVVAELHRTGSRLQNGMNGILMRHGIAARLAGLEVCPQFVSDDPELIPRLLRAAFAEGVSLYSVVYVNRAHTDADIDDALRRLDRAWAGLA